METQQKKPSTAVNISVAITMAIIILIGYRTCTKEKEEPIKAIVALHASSFTLTSQSANYYSDVILEVNGEYQLKIDTLHAFESKTIQFLEFTSDKGSAFNIYSDKVRELTITGAYFSKRYSSTFNPN